MDSEDNDESNYEPSDGESGQEVESDFDEMDDDRPTTSRSTAATPQPTRIIGIKASVKAILRQLKAERKPDPSGENLASLVALHMKVPISVQQIRSLMSTARTAT